MLTLDTIIARVPLLLRYALAALVLCGLILVIVVQRAGILRSGQEVRLETAPVDPRDLFRGDYVVLDYRIGTVNAPSDVTTQFRREQRVFVTLRPDDNGKAKAVAIAAEQPAVTGNDIVIAGFVTTTSACPLNDAGARDCKLGPAPSACAMASKAISCRKARARRSSSRQGRGWRSLRPSHHQARRRSSAC